MYGNFYVFIFIYILLYYNFWNNEHDRSIYQRMLKVKVREKEGESGKREREKLKRKE